MKEISKLRWFFIIGFVFVNIAGTISHFVYDWFPSDFTAVFFAVNESTWEHMKLAFFPMFIYFLAGYPIVGKRYNNYVFAMFLALAISTILIPILFYGYTAIIGKSIIIIDISIFVISVFAGFVAAYFAMIREDKKALNAIGIIGIVILTACFLTFTFYPPQIFLFKDPITGGYGIPL